MLDVSVAYNRFKFIGDEFLTWLWYHIENHPDKLLSHDEELFSVTLGNRIVLENRATDAKETISIKGDDAGLEEGLLALGKGAVVVELNLCLKTENLEWRFSIKGEHLSLAGLKAPQTGVVKTPEEVEGAVLEKAYLYERALKFIDNVYRTFLRVRLSNDWPEKDVKDIKDWINSRSQ